MSACVRMRYTCMRVYIHVSVCASRLRDRMTPDKRDRIESLRAQMAAAPLMEQKLIFREQIKVLYALDFVSSWLTKCFERTENL